MNNRTSDPVFMRNVLLVLSGVLMLLTYFVSGGRLVSCMVTPYGPLNVMFTAATALLAAVVVMRFAYMLLRGPDSPWYIRPGAIALLAIIVPCGGVSFIAFDAPVRTWAGTLAVIPIQACILEFLSMLLLFVVILDWPTQRFSTYTRPRRRFKVKRKDYDDSDPTDGNNSVSQVISRWL